jgi:DNA-binding transcriptional regulator YiaG
VSIVARVSTESILELRQRLRLSRAEFARFLGVSEATIVRWESNDTVSEPRGLQAVLLRVISDAAAQHGPQQVARTVRSCGVDHRAALKTLLSAAG